MVRDAMPDSYIEWAWFAFFGLGTIGGWGALLRTLQLWVQDRRNSDPNDLLVEDVPALTRRPDTRTRANLPIYQPRRR
jgi:hypothetical protein